MATRELPRVTVNSLIKDVAGSQRCDAELKELIHQCCSEFLSLVTSEANEICSSSEHCPKNHSTLSLAHLKDSLKNLGFESYIEEIDSIQEKAPASRKRKRNNLEASGKSMEELAEDQRKLFEKSRKKVFGK
eukprot:277120_1